MKRSLLVLVLLVSFISFSQQESEKSPKKNEITTNLLDLVVAGSFNVNYERLLKNNQSFAISATLFDTYGYYDVGYMDNNNTFTLKASYIIYFSKNKDHAGFLFYPQIKLRTGEITVNGYYYGQGNQGGNFKYDIDGFSAGFGLGHKWLFNDKFTLGINGEIARNLGGLDDYLEPIEVRASVSFGFRF